MYRCDIICVLGKASCIGLHQIAHTIWSIFMEHRKLKKATENTLTNSFSFIRIAGNCYMFDIIKLISDMT